MTATEAKNDFDLLIFRLERNHKCVLRMSKNLNSYKYEPKNYDCFLKFRELKGMFQQLAEDQMVLFDLIQHKELDLQTAVQKVDASLQRFNTLEKEMAAYLLSL